jgi:hypothetical protein
MVRVGDPRQFSRIPLTAVMTRVMDLRDSDVIHHDGKSKVVHEVENAENGFRVVALRALKEKTPRRVRFYSTKYVPLVRPAKSPKSVFDFPDPYSITR